MPQEPGSILAGCPRAAYGDAPALTPLSLQGEVGSPGQPGLPGPKVGASGDWDRLCASIWGLQGAGEDPCAPQCGAAGGMLCTASHSLLCLVAGGCWCARCGWSSWPGGLPWTAGRNISSLFSEAPRLLQAEHPCLLQGHLQQLHPQQPKSAPSSQNPRLAAKIQACSAFGCCPALGLGSLCAVDAHTAWDLILISLPPCLPSPPPKSIPPQLAAWTLQVAGGGLKGFAEPQAGGGPCL